MAYKNRMTDDFMVKWYLFHIVTSEPHRTKIFFDMTDKIVVFSACSTLDEARRIARKLIEERLASCVNLTPGVRSLYRWKGAIEEADECLLVIKSSRDLFDRLRLELEKAHTYEVPEVVAVPILAGSPNYMNWLDSELKSSDV